MLCIALVPGNPEDHTVKLMYTQMYKLFLKYRDYYLSFFPIGEKPSITIVFIIVIVSLIKKPGSVFFVFFMFFEYIK